jgi:amidase
VPNEDAPAVGRLKLAGAILLGKTNCPPGGSGGDTENVVYGRTHNPYRLECTPGGGSGADAALVAAGGVPIALGSDAGGTLRLSAHYCGVAALKPTTGRVPNTGAYNQPGGLSDPFAQVGLIARRVADLALVLPLICGPDQADAGAIPMPLPAPGAVCLGELTVAYFLEDHNAPVTDATADIVGATAQALARAGVLMEEMMPPDFVGDARGNWENWGNRASLRGQDVVEVLREIDHYRSRLLQFMRRYDAILCPVDTHPAPAHKARDPHRFDYTRPFSLTGWPVVTVRAGTAPDGLPIGVQIAARPWREDVAQALAAAVERGLGGWQVVTPS